MANKNPSPKTRFKRGQVANPRGAGAHDSIKRALKRLTAKEFHEVIEASLSSDLGALKTITKDSSASALKVGVARALIKAVQGGDWKTLNAIAERIVGRVPEQLEESETNIQVTLTMPANGREVLGLEELKGLSVRKVVV